jgi:DNA-binding LacI/PurR family transcriptional regulator
VPAAERVPDRRPTIADVAARAGVSIGAVSFALNGKPGVSAATRARILAVADDLGWRPNSAARSLSFARAGAVGFVLARPARTLGDESFYMQLITGMEAELSRSSTALMLQVVDTVEDSVAAYQRWSAQGRVDGVVVTDVRHVDPRPEALRALRLPAVVIGGDGSTGLPRVWSEDADNVREVVDHLTGLGHERVAYVSGSPEFLHTTRRTEAFADAMTARGLRPKVVVTDFSAARGREATRRLLALRRPPTAIVYDSDAMAVAGLGVATSRGIAVPGELSIVAWDDSLLCQVVHPSLTSVARDIRALGAMAAVQLAAVLAAGPGGEAPADLVDPTPRLVVRESTAAPGPAGVKR